MSSQNNPNPWMLVWSEELSVGIAEIDSEHQHFIVLVNELNEAIGSRMDIEEIKRRMQAILADAATHFAHEEQLFAQWQFPLATEHALIHQQLTRALHDIMHVFDNGLEYEWINAGLQVKQALIEHMLHEDMKYRDFYLSREEAHG